MLNSILLASQATVDAATEAATQAAEQASGGMNWMFISAIVLVAGMTVIGFAVGFFRMLLSTFALLLALVGAYFLGGPISDKVADSGIGKSVEKRIETFINENVKIMPGEEDLERQNKGFGTCRFRSVSRSIS